MVVQFGWDRFALVALGPRRGGFAREDFFFRACHIDAWRRATREEVLERRASHVAHCSACSGALSNAVKGRRGADAAVVASLMWAALMARWRAPALTLAATAYGVGRACESLEHRMTFGVYPPPRNK